jgi:hypothetical protein
VTPDIVFGAAWARHGIANAPEKAECYEDVGFRWEKTQNILAQELIITVGNAMGSKRAEDAL